VVTFYLFLPETKNRTLEDIDAFFVGSTNPLQPVKVARNMLDGGGPPEARERSDEYKAHADEFEKA
jgi:hypothetical protein